MQLEILASLKNLEMSLVKEAERTTTLQGTVHALESKMQLVEQNQITIHQQLDSLLA